MSGTDKEFELVVGGVHGIHIHSTRHSHAGPRVEAPQSGEPRRLIEGRRWMAAYGHLGAAALAVVSLVMVGLAVVLIESLGLPRVFYVPAGVIAGTAAVAAVAARALQGRTRRSLSAEREQEILALAARTTGPLTIADTARALGMPLTEAEEVLSGMSRAGHATADVDLETGQLQFSVPVTYQPLRQEFRS